MSGGDPPPEEEEAEIECAICFDAVAESTKLPCNCRVAYCGRCWDRALAHSFRACGQARCPSCRGPVRVDFDPDAAGGRGRLVFGRETEDHTYSRQLEALGAAGEAPPSNEAALLSAALAARQRAWAVAEAREQVVQRLAEQAMPVQIRLLERFGAAKPLLSVILMDPQQALGKQPVAELRRRLEALGGSAAGCAEKADLISQLLATAGSAAALAACWAAGEAPAPECVCGGALTRVDGRGRTRRYLKSARPDLPEGSAAFEAMLDGLTSQGSCGVICDLCENSQLEPDSGVWTCGRGDDTIIHATAYDVCEACFLRHALGHHRTTLPELAAA